MLHLSQFLILLSCYWLYSEYFQCPLSTNAARKVELKFNMKSTVVMFRFSLVSGELSSPILTNHYPIISNLFRFNCYRGYTCVPYWPIPRSSAFCCTFSTLLVVCVCFLYLVLTLGKMLSVKEECISMDASQIELYSLRTALNTE